jgi:DNA-binding NarL/FixJ family response regulator
MSIKVFLADNQDVFRAGLARFLALEDEFRIIGQCDDLQRLYKVAQSGDAVIAFASSLKPDLERLVLEARATDSQLLAILECGESPQRYLLLGVQGVIYRDVNRDELLMCFRSLAKRRAFLQKGISSGGYEADSVGGRVRSRLSRKELQILRLLLRGYKNKDIAQELNNTEQVIKNYLRSIFDKTGVSDRLELVLFTMHHKVLLDAAEAAVPGSPTPPDTISSSECVVPIPGSLSPASLVDATHVA